MIAAFRRAEGFRGESAVTTWLHRIVVNASLDRLRRLKVRAADALPDDLDDHAARGAVVAGAAPEADPEAAGPRLGPAPTGARRARGAAAGPEGGARAGRHGGLPGRRGGRDPRGPHRHGEEPLRPRACPARRPCSATCWPRERAGAPDLPDSARVRRTQETRRGRSAPAETRHRPSPTRPSKEVSGHERRRTAAPRRPRTLACARCSPSWAPGRTARRCLRTWPRGSTTPSPGWSPSVTRTGRTTSEAEDTDARVVPLRARWLPRAAVAAAAVVVIGVGGVATGAFGLLTGSSTSRLGLRGRLERGEERAGSPPAAPLEGGDPAATPRRRLRSRGRPARRTPRLLPHRRHRPAPQRRATPLTSPEAAAEDDRDRRHPGRRWAARPRGPAAPGRGPPTGPPPPRSGTTGRWLRSSSTPRRRRGPAGRGVDVLGGHQVGQRAGDPVRLGPMTGPDTASAPPPPTPGRPRAAHGQRGGGARRTPERGAGLVGRRRPGPAGPHLASERLSVEVDGRPVEVRELRVADGGRLHVCQAPPGRLLMSYAAEVDGPRRPGHRRPGGRGRLPPARAATPSPTSSARPAGRSSPGSRARSCSTRSARGSAPSSTTSAAPAGTPTAPPRPCSPGRACAATSPTW